MPGAADAEHLAGLIGPAPLARFEACLSALGCGADDALGLAVSGGSDSSALLLLVAAARPGRVFAATVDHGLRSESAAEAAGVAGLCARLGVPHATLRVTVEPQRGGLQAAAREVRYDALNGWCPAPWLLTAHQRDDVAESLLMRIARGSGVRGLARMAEHVRLRAGLAMLRPLLDWSRAELLGICAAAGVDPADDPSNQDPRFDRTRARQLLARTAWLEPERLARAAANLADADAALDYYFELAWSERIATDEPDLLAIDAEKLPHDTRRRIAARAIEWIGGLEPPREGLETFLARLGTGDHATLAGVHAHPGPPWRFTPAPPRREIASAR